MPWSEDEFRRALEGAAQRARPSGDALAMLRARERRLRVRVRAGGLAFAGAAATVVALVFVAVSQRSPAPQDVELAGPAPAGTAAASAAPSVREAAGGGSILPAISTDGRFVAFTSEASNLVAGDTNHFADTFVRDLTTGRVERASVSSAGDQGNGESLSASPSRAGSFVAFRSHASNLVSGDTNRASDIFVRDRTAGTTVRVSTAADGSQANGESDSASISGDGTFVAFRSAASNLVIGDTNGRPDVFLKDLRSGRIDRVSVSTAGGQANGDNRNPHVSADGTRVAFSSIASSLVAGDTNRTWDVFVRDMSAGTTTRVSVSRDGRQGNLASTLPAISADGRVVAFASAANNLVFGDDNGARDIFVRDIAARTTERVSIASDGAEANASSFSASLSEDGRAVAFSSDASNLVAGDSNRHRDVFLRDRATGAVTLASASSSGDRGNADSGGPSLSGAGRFVVFQTLASNLGAGDTNKRVDVYLHDFPNRTTTRLSGSR